MLNAGNNVKCTLVQSVLSTHSLLHVDINSGFPDTPFLMTIFNPLDDSGDNEIVKVTDVDDGTLVVERGQENTTARDWDEGDVLENRFTAGMYEGLKDSFLGHMSNVSKHNLYAGVVGVTFTTDIVDDTVDEIVDGMTITFRYSEQGLYEKTPVLFSLNGVGNIQVYKEDMTPLTIDELEDRIAYIAVYSSDLESFVIQGKGGDEIQSQRVNIDAVMPGQTYQDIRFNFKPLVIIGYIFNVPDNGYHLKIAGSVDLSGIKSSNGAHSLNKTATQIRTTATGAPVLMTTVNIDFGLAGGGDLNLPANTVRIENIPTTYRTSGRIIVTAYG